MISLWLLLYSLLKKRRRFYFHVEETLLEEVSQFLHVVTSQPAMKTKPYRARNYILYPVCAEHLVCESVSYIATLLFNRHHFGGKNGYVHMHLQACRKLPRVGAAIKMGSEASIKFWLINYS